MTDHDLDDTAGLGARLTQLTETRPEPLDPAVPIRARIKRHRRRRTGLALAGTAAATALTVLAGPAVVGALTTGRDPGAADFGPAASPSATPSSPGTSPSNPPTMTPSLYGEPSAAPSQGDHRKVLPRPWSAKRFTKLPDANAYRPAAYYIAQGTIPTEDWALLAFSRQACLVSSEGPANSFGTPYLCRGNLKKDFMVVQGYAKEKDAPKIDHSMVLGFAPVNARRVRISYRGGSRLTDAVATPATDQVRFFGVVIPKRDLRNVTVTPLDAAGKPVS